jgi:glycerophosphoryl diester phosphodiesterase
MDWLTNKPITHRGLFDNVTIPENSIAAFELAVKSGYPIELDLQFLNDGHIAIFHDSSLVRMTGKNSSICSVSLEELKSLKLLETNQSIPLLEEVLESVDGKVPLILEIKNPLFPARFEHAIIKLLKGYKGEFAVESFNPLSVLWMKIFAKRILRGQLSRSLFRANLYSKITHPDFLAVDISKLKYGRKKSVKRKIPVIAYTAKSQAEFTKAMTICDNVIFEGFEPDFL